MDIKNMGHLNQKEQGFLVSIQNLDQSIEALKENRRSLVSAEAERRGGKYLCNKAFHVMQYECEKCKKTEILWNSRDGVTPFAVSCRACNEGMMNHIKWEEDYIDLDYVPVRGSRVFVDATPEIFKITLRALVDANWDNPVYPMSKSFTSKQDAIEQMSGELNTGDPYVLTL